MFSRFWNWIKSFFKKSTEIYAPKERLIYKYWNGEKIVSVDPMVIAEKIDQHSITLTVDAKVAFSMSPDAPKAYQSMLNAIREIFGVKEFQEGKGGLTRLETMGLIDQFNTWVEELKKNSPLGQIPVEETSARFDPPWVVGLNTKNSSGSGSTDKEPKTGQPESSNSVQPTQTEQPQPTVVTLNPTAAEQTKQD